MNYQESISRGLTKELLSCTLSDIYDVRDLHFVVMADLHMGLRDKADDFLESSSTYIDALTWYLLHNYNVILLGDVQELWENDTEDVSKCYCHQIELEDRYHVRRLGGNHDAVLGNKTSFLMTIYHKENSVGRIFLVHGHQGTDDSDRFAGISKFFVRYIWRPIQFVFGGGRSTPSTNLKLSDAHEKAMALWTSKQYKMITVAGHTHHAVATKNSRYFNAGCCCYDDGSIHALEFTNGMIILSKWLHNGTKVVEFRQNILDAFKNG